jgi:hypothetical protein
MSDKLPYGVITQEKPFFLEGNSIYFRNKNGFGIDFTGPRTPQPSVIFAVLETLNKTYQVGFDEGTSAMSKMVVSMQTKE